MSLRLEKELENENEKIFVFKTIIPNRLKKYKSSVIKRGIVRHNGGHNNDTNLFLGTKFKERGRSVNYGIYLQKNGKLGYMYSSGNIYEEKDLSFYDKLPIMTRMYLYTINDNQKFFNHIFPFLDDCYWKQVFYQECQEAALQFLMCCKFGKIPIHKDIQQKIARYIYNMHNTWIKIS